MPRKKALREVRVESVRREVQVFAWSRESGDVKRRPVEVRREGGDRWMVEVGRR